MTATNQPHWEIDEDGDPVFMSADGTLIEEVVHVNDELAYAPVVPTFSTAAHAALVDLIRSQGEQAERPQGVHLRLTFHLGRAFGPGQHHPAHPPASEQP